MESLGGEILGTRMDLDNAMGQDWERDEPSWAREVSLVNQSFPNPLDLSRDRPMGQVPGRTLSGISGPTWAWGCRGKLCESPEAPGAYPVAWQEVLKTSQRLDRSM